MDIEKTKHKRWAKVHIVQILETVDTMPHGTQRHYLKGLGNTLGLSLGTSHISQWRRLFGRRGEKLRAEIDAGNFRW